ncbi:MAG: HEAT repeat domain-containing protein [Planctomycetota bacterium]|nr:HEAT repeat domain-containing protein [Planctomycetota bacterium]
MRTPCRFALPAVVLAMAIAAPAALGQVTLRLRFEPGQAFLYDRTVKTESQARTGKDNRRMVWELQSQRQELITDTRPEPAGGHILTLDSPQPERLAAYEENGKDLLASIPEQQRLRPMPPILSIQWRDPKNEPADRIEKATDAGQALELLYAAMRVLPEDVIRAGDSWTREMDLGVLKAKITTRYVDQRSENLVQCAVLASSAEVTFAPEFAKTLTVEKMTAQSVVALDGSAVVGFSGTAILIEKNDNGQERVTRTYQEKLVRSDRLEAAVLAKAKVDMERLNKAFLQSKADDLEGALATLEQFLKDNPQPGWAGAIQNIYGSLNQRRLLTKPVPAAKLQVMLQELKNNRDRAATQGSPAQVAQLDQIIRQVTTVNLKGLQELMKDPDVINRDLAAFGLGFVQDAQAGEALRALAADASPQVRGTAALSLGLQGKPVDVAITTALLKDDDPRVRGSGVFMVGRTVKKDDPQAATVLPLVVEALQLTSGWTRAQAASALAIIAPKNSVAAAAALVNASKTELDQNLKALYLKSLKEITGLDAPDLAPYEEWLKKQPAAPPAKAPEKAPPAKAKG